MARPRIVIDWNVFDALCGVRCTLEEIASQLDCSPDTIERAVQRERRMGFAEYFKLKGGKGPVALRRKQYQLAMQGNPTMLIWLGKQWLGQREKFEHTGKDGADLPPVSVVSVYVPDNGRDAVHTNGNGRKALAGRAR